ncbi:MAG: hypothetical protein AABX39_04345 [Nanoarchaeota archaeon]
MAVDTDLEQITGSIIESNGSLTDFTYAQLTSAVKEYFNANVDKFPKNYSPLNIVQDLLKSERIKETSKRGLYSFDKLF